MFFSFTVAAFGFDFLIKMAHLYASPVTFVFVSLLTLCSLLLYFSVLVEQIKDTSPEKTTLIEKPVEITPEVCVRRCVSNVRCNRCI